MLQLDTEGNVWCKASAWFMSSCAVRFLGLLAERKSTCGCLGVD